MSNIRICEEDFSKHIELAKFLNLLDPQVFFYEYLTYMPQHHVYVTAIDEEGHIVGSQALMPYVLNINGKEILTGRSERTLLSHSLRGRKYFPVLMNECVKRGNNRGLKFIWGATTAIKPFQETGFFFHHNFIEHSLCCLKPVAMIKSLIRETRGRLKFKMAKLLTAPISMAIRTIKPLWIVNSGLDIRLKLENALDIIGLYDKLRKSQKIVSLVQDDKFIDWAYNLSSGRKYLRLYAYREERLRAYIHLDLTHPNVGYLADFAELERGGIAILLQEAKVILRNTNHSVIHASYNIKNSQLRRTAKSLYQCGFVPISRDGHMCIRPLEFIDINVLGDISMWYITQIWWELYKQPDKRPMC